MHYPGEIEIWPFPETLDDALAKGLEEAQLDPYSVRELLAGGGGQEGSDSQVIRNGSETYRLCRDPQKGLILNATVDDAGFGCSQFVSSALVDVLVAKELAFVASDGGLDEEDGKEFSWHPGLAKLRQRAYMGGEGPALSSSEFEALRARSSNEQGLLDPLKLGELLVEHFDNDPSDWWPGKPPISDLFEPQSFQAEKRERPSGLSTDLG
jgi:hypothetical protein